MEGPGRGGQRVIALDQWRVAHHQDAGGSPSEWVPAAVPGAVQLDWARAHGWPEWWKNDHFRQYGWMESVFWTYRHDLAWPALGEGEKLVLVAEGIDYRFEIRLDGEALHCQEGMFRPAQVDLTPFWGGGCCLEILIFPPPMLPIQPGEQERRQADRTCKPPVSYGWDFHPRLIPSGIWQPIRLEVRQPSRIASLEVSFELSDNFSSASVLIEAQVEAGGSAWLDWILADPEGEEAERGSLPLSGSGLFQQLFTLEHPRLWWPRDMGSPDRYTLTGVLRGHDGAALDRLEKRFGFRRTRLGMHEGQWDMDCGIPATQVPPPITLEVNGRKTFVKGSCLTPPDVFFGAIHDDTYRRMVDLALGAHFNLLRVWGGGIIPPEVFFEACDEKGLMVWQEFPLSCNPYEASPEYLAVLEPEARAIIRRVRSHPSHVLWCGGNELFNYWSRSTMQNRALRLLDSLCLEMDPLKPFIPTAPLTGMGHGWYAFRHVLTGQDILEYFQEARCTAYTEFGCSGASPVDHLRRFIPEDDLFPPKPGTAWEWHHGLLAFCEEGIGWLCLPYIEDYFGPCQSLEEMVRGSEWLQCEGIKSAFEEARRQEPRCSMAVSWCFNEPWPTAANCGLINWPADPKPSYFAARDACRPQMLSLRFPRFDYRREGSLAAEAWLLNDLESEAGPQDVTLTLESGGREIGRRDFTLPGAKPSQNTQGPREVFSLAEALPGELKVTISSRQNPEFASTYRLLVRPDH